MSIIFDNLGRKIDYLRISITDRCNLRCNYCMPKEGIKCTPEENLLTLEEMYRIAKLASELGVTKIRITGGEPLIRKGIENFIRELKCLPGINEVCITTNGTFLEEKIDELADAGLDSINISLDTMKEDLFKDITLFGDLSKVMKGIDLSINKGLKVKLNTVIMNGVNDSEIIDFVNLTELRPLDVRFLELMPIGEGKKFESFSSDKIKAIISQNKKLIPCEGHNRQDGPAVYYKTEKGLGKVGFISAVSHSFCGECNRIRLTSQGFLKQCLFLNTGKDLRSLIREGISDNELKLIMESSIRNKPHNHDVNENITAVDSKYMNEIGG